MQKISNKLNRTTDQAAKKGYKICICEEKNQKCQIFTVNFDKTPAKGTEEALEKKLKY